MAKRIKHDSYKLELRIKEVDGIEQWQFRSPDCAKWTKIDEAQFNGTKDMPSDSAKPKKINFKRLTKINRRIKYELARTVSEISR